MGKLEVSGLRNKEKSGRVLWHQSWCGKELLCWCVQPCTFQEWPSLSCQGAVPFEILLILHVFSAMGL